MRRQTNDIIDLSRRMRLRALEMAYKSGQNGAHVGGGLSASEIMATLYHDVLHVDPCRPFDDNRDRLIVSKGHCVLAYYTALYEKGFLSAQDLEQFEQNGYHWHGHAMRDLTHGIEFHGGSLSMGMSFAVGEALACKAKGLQSRVFVLVGDGECDEGLIWEAAMSAAHHQLDNLCVIVDRNRLQYDGETKEVMNTDSLTEKFKAFGFEVAEVNGHDCEALSRQLSVISSQPRCVIANTIKGKGVSFMENDKTWHHHTLNEAQYNQAREEVEHAD